MEKINTKQFPIIGIKIEEEKNIMSEHHNHHKKFDYNRSFAIGIVLNISFVAIEAIYGIIANSLSLIADAGHNLTDVVGLLLAWGASYLASLEATERKTYGYRKITVMASLLSAVLLLLGLGAIIWEALQRFSKPQTLEGSTIIIVASIGVIINIGTALLFVSGQKNDLNIRGAFLHMIADAGVSLSVVIGGIFILFVNFNWIDPVITIIIAIVILVVTWGLFKDSIDLSLDFVPKNIDISAIKKYLLNLENILQIHDLHVWALSTTETALTVHLVAKNQSTDINFLLSVQTYLHDNFGIEHTTIQIEIDSEYNHCMLEEKCNVSHK